MSIREKVKHEWVHLKRAVESQLHHVKSVLQVTHLSYFAMVAFHGPYHLAAMVLLIIGLTLLIFRIELEL